MKIAENKMKQRAPNEVVYYGQYGEDPYKFNVTRMDSHGGWIASAQDLAIFLDHVAGAGSDSGNAQAGDDQIDDDARACVSARVLAGGTPAAGWFATMARVTGGTTAAFPVPAASWCERPLACAGPVSPTLAPSLTMKWTLLSTS